MVRTRDCCLRSRQALRVERGACGKRLCICRRLRRSFTHHRPHERGLRPLRSLPRPPVARELAGYDARGDRDFAAPAARDPELVTRQEAARPSKSELAPPVTESRPPRRCGTRGTTGAHAPGRRAPETGRGRREGTDGRSRGRRGSNNHTRSCALSRAAV